MEELLNKFRECFGTWGNNILHCELVDDEHIKIWLGPPKSVSDHVSGMACYIFGSKNSGEEISLETVNPIDPYFAQK